MSKHIDVLGAFLAGSLASILLTGWLVGLGKEFVFEDCEKLGRARFGDQVISCAVEK